MKINLCAAYDRICHKKLTQTAPQILRTSGQSELLNLCVMSLMFTQMIAYTEFVSRQWYMVLTHLSLAFLLWDIGKQNSPRCDAAECGVPSEAILFA